MPSKSLFIRILIIASLLLVNLKWGIVSASPFNSETQSVILYVKPGANGDCLSWDAACELQTALSLAQSGDQIWVAAGTYKPTTDTDRTATFQMESGVAIYGGFPATGGEWTQRNWVNNLTTLSGDIGSTKESSDNSNHVVTADYVDSASLLDGFTISGGYAQGEYPEYRGGGLYNIGGNPTLTNVIFSTNYASGGGGGMSNHYGSPTLTNVTFSGNSGGGMSNRDGNPTLTNVTFSGNSGGGMSIFEGRPTLTNVSFIANYGGGLANSFGSLTLTNVSFSSNTADYGGGLRNTQGNLTLTNVTFDGNTAIYNGGGMILSYSGSPTLTNVTFNGNTAGGDGGGIYLDVSSPRLINVIFNLNTASENGGGMYNFAGRPTLTDVTFSGNTASVGGGIYNRRGYGTWTNVTFSDNSADANGGGIYNEDSSNLKLMNVTFSSNSAGSGGGIYNDYASNPTLTNSILWDNTPDQINNVRLSTTTITYSDIHGGYPGTGNINENPLLGSLADNGGFTQTHAIAAGSPAIDAGDPNLCPDFDQRGFVRPIDGDYDGIALCDMGAYENGAESAFYKLNLEIIGNGDVDVSPVQPKYALGDQVTLTANASPDWRFTGWSGDITSTDNPLVFTIAGNTSITANFTDTFYIYLPLILKN